MKILLSLFTWLIMASSLAYAQEDYFLTYQNSTQSGALNYTNDTFNQSWGSPDTFIASGTIAVNTSQIFVASDTTDHFWDTDVISGTVTLGDGEEYTVSMINPGSADSYFQVSYQSGTFDTFTNDLPNGNILTISFMGGGCIAPSYNGQPLPDVYPVVNLNGNNGITCPTTPPQKLTTRFSTATGTTSALTSTTPTTTTKKVPPISQTGIFPW